MVMRDHRRKQREEIDKGFLISFIMLTVVSFNLEAQVDNSDRDIRSYKIDSVSITAPKEYRSLMKEPYTEPFSLLPVISTVVRQIQNRALSI
jgi:hypothetical protein